MLSLVLVSQFFELVSSKTKSKHTALTHTPCNKEDISVQLEEPFDILPLRQYSDGIFESVQAIERGFHK